jgi:hypothetical protein
LEIKNKILILVLFPLLFACGKDNYDWTNKTDDLYKHNEKKISITEGIWGTLIQREGNWMPGADGNRKEFPAQRKVAVYEYTTVEEIKGYPTSCEVFTKLIATTTCDKEGFYELKLKPGRYSVFLKEKGKLYANSGDGDGGINPVIVETSKVSEMNLVIDYAVY